MGCRNYTKSGFLKGSYEIFLKGNLIMFIQHEPLLLQKAIYINKVIQRNF